jgi:predicted dehydrogenase
MDANTGPIQSILVGAGNRGAEVYGQFALMHPWLFRFVAVADPNPVRREKFSRQHGIPEEKSADSWEKLLESATPANLVFICSPDRFHYEQVLAFMEKGCPIVLEKPVVVNPRQCATLSKLVPEKSAKIIVCHVLRYTPFFSTLKRLLDGGRIGRVTSFNLQENIAWYHFAHSYVRGNWRNSALSSPSILAKSVHDLDILYWLGGAPAESLVSMGDLSWFREENAPAGAPDRCLQGCPHAGTCPWYAPDLYLTENTGWPTSVISDDQSLPARRQVLETGPYGRCVYHCDNDVADHQDVLIRFKNGISAAFSMNALTYGKTRVIQATGSEGEIIGDLDEGWLEVRSFLHGEKERIRMGASVGGHNGGDVGLMHDVARIFGRADCGEAQADTGGISASKSSIEASLEGHWMAFAAEESRKKGIFVDLDAYRDMVSTRETVNI